MMQVMHLQEVPRIEIPLHTLIELVPKPDGKMAEERIKFDLQHESVGLLPEPVRQHSPGNTGLHAHRPHPLRLHEHAAGWILLSSSIRLCLLGAIGSFSKGCARPLHTLNSILRPG